MIRLLVALLLLSGCTGTTTSMPSEFAATSGNWSSSAIASGVEPSVTADAALASLVLKGVTVLDDHEGDVFSWTAAGNCNGRADAGETVQLAFNVVNEGATTVGPFQLRIAPNPLTSDIELISTLHFAAWQKLKPGQNWIQAIPEARPARLFGEAGTIVLSSYLNMYMNGLLGFKLGANATGRYNFILSANLLDSQNRAIKSVTFLFTLPIGRTPTATSCPSGPWPGGGS